MNSTIGGHLVEGRRIVHQVWELVWMIVATLSISALRVRRRIAGKVSTVDNIFGRGDYQKVCVSFALRVHYLL